MMTPVIIDIPTVPKEQPDPKDSSGKTMIPVSKIDIYPWKEKHKKTSAKLDKYKVDMARAFIKLFFTNACQASRTRLRRRTLSRQFAWPKTQLPSSN
jgi:hypothetical protein